GAGERDDVALVSVRGDVAESSANLNREWQPVYQMDIAAGAAPSIANNGAGGGVNLSVPAASAQSPYPIACVADLPHPLTIFVGAGPNQRDPDNLISYPRASDLAVTVFDGAPGGGITHNLWGADATADTPDDALFPGDILVVKFSGQSHLYHFPITGVDGASNNTFYIRTDRCDFVPGGTVTEFRVIRTAKLIDFAPLSEIRNPGERDIPQGLLFSSVRTARTAAVAREDFKDFALLDDGADVTGLVSFSTGGLNDAAGATHVGAFDVLSCLDATVTRPSLLLGGCAALTAEQSNDPTSPTALHMESPNGAGAVLMDATARFAYLLSSQTGEILVFRRSVGGSPDLVATLYPTIGLIGNGGFGISESALSNPIGEISSFSSLRLGEATPDSRVLAINPRGSVTVLEEVVLGGEYIARYDDTDDISGFSAIDYPLIAAPGTGQAGVVLDGMVVGDAGSGFMGSINGFVLPGRVGRESLASLGMIDFTGRAPIDFDPDTYQIDGLDTGGRAFVAFDFDPGRQQLFGILQTGSSDGYELRAWDLAGMEEVDLTTEVQGVSCQSSGAGAKLSFTAAQSGTAIPTSMAARDGVVLIGFYSGGPSLAVVDTDNLLPGQFLAGLGCDLDIEDPAVLIPLDAGSPSDVQDVAIQGDLAFVAGSIGNSTHVLTALDMAPLWRDRGCGSFTCLPRDLRGLQPGFNPEALSNPPVNLELHGNLLFVSTERGVSGDGIEVFDVAPYSYGFAPPASPTASISYHAPDKVATLPGSLDVGGCAGRMSVGGNGLYVADGRLRFEIAGGGPSDCDLDYVCPSGDPVEANLYVVNLASPTFNRASPPDLSVSCQRLGDPASEIRDIIFLPPDPLP
ncbi:MAG: hypothetical protein KDH09_11385, partial [Chrysiogenetes bacterium]|nr:hypothetical protein [Chrysiogenetes bacterium]